MIDITVKIEAGPELKVLLEKILDSKSSKETFEWIGKIQSKVEKRGNPEQGQKSKYILFSRLNPEEKEKIKKRALELSNKHKPMEVKRIINAEFPNICVSDPVFYYWRDKGREKPSEEPQTPQTKKKFGNIHSKKKMVREAISKEHHTATAISTYLSGEGYNMSPRKVSMFIYHNMGGELIKENIREPGSGDTEGNYYYLENQKKEKPPPADKKPVIKSSLPKGSQGPKIDVSGLKPVKIATDDLLVVNGQVMCPKSNIAVPADDCPECNGHIAKVRSEETDEPYVRCLKAGKV